MDLSKCNVGMAITGSFCTFDKIKIEIKKMVEMGINVYPIFSPHSAEYDTRFGKADKFVNDVETIAGRKGIYTIQEAEPIGPKAYLDALVIAPCTGNTIAKLPVSSADIYHISGSAILTECISPSKIEYRLRYKT